MSDAQLDGLFEFLRFRTISTRADAADSMHECAEWLAGRFRAGGMDARVQETGGHPAVVAMGPQEAGRPTVLIYGHYDVQPPDPLEEWESDPFDPVIREGRIFARGATDNKGQIMAHIEGVSGMGEPPVNVKFLVEGEEEVGSPNLVPLIGRLRDELACDVVLISDTAMVADAYPTLTYGLRGVAGLEVRVQGPSHDLHSGLFGGAVANPATALARILSTLHDPSGRVSVEGFYDDVEELTPNEREAWAGLPVTDEQIRLLSGAPELFGESGYSAFERICGRPTIEINGMGSGYQGEGTKTVLPASAFAKLTFRTVPHQRSDEVARRVEEHLHRQALPGIRIRTVPGHSGDPYFCSPASRWAQAATCALRKTFRKEPALIREGGSIPIVPAFRDLLGADSLLVALGNPDSRLHSPNENFPVRNFLTGIELSRSILAEIAEQTGFSI